MTQEVDEVGLQVEGRLPDGLDGTYLPGCPPRNRTRRVRRPEGDPMRWTDLDESGRAWAMICGILFVIFADLAAIILMNTVGK
ncbi:hypothetical protein OV450_0132 [Actinobacteria bacterium OV450]|nr:hypothetical protein OV450_0132 [Actinobacteria bacterium OV450]